MLMLHLNEWIINNIFYQYHNLVIFSLFIVVIIGASYLANSPVYKMINGLTYTTTTPSDNLKSRSSWSNGDIIIAVVLPTVMISIHSYFSG
jgi:hypothetical protein